MLIPFAPHIVHSRHAGAIEKIKEYKWHFLVQGSIKNHFYFKVVSHVTRKLPMHHAQSEDPLWFIGNRGNPFTQIIHRPHGGSLILTSRRCWTRSLTSGEKFTSAAPLAYLVARMRKNFPAGGHRTRK